MPNKIMEQLAADLQTSPANIRQIRIRAMAKVRAYFAANSDHYDEGQS